MGRAERRHKPKQDFSYIHQEKRWKSHIRGMVRKIFAGICLTLHRKYDMSTSEIIEFLTAVQDLWQRDGEYGFDILKTCLEETGVNLAK